MYYNIHRLDVAYGVFLADPAFELPTIGPAVFSTFYKALNPRFSVTLSDMQNPAARSYEEYAYIINLFGGAGILTIRAHGLTAAFQRLKTETDLKLIVDCMHLSEESYFAVLPKSELKNRKFEARSWLSCEGGIDAIDELLRQRSGSGHMLGLTNQSIDQAFPRLGLDFLSKSDGWGGRFTLERSEINEADLYFSLDTSYLKHSTFESIGAQIDHTRHLYLSVLQELGLEPNEESGDGGRA